MGVRGLGALLDHILAILQDPIDVVLVDHADGFLDQPVPGGPVGEAEPFGAEIVALIGGAPIWIILEHLTRRVGFGQGEVQAEFHAQRVHVIGQRVEPTGELGGIRMPVADTSRPTQIHRE